MARTVKGMILIMVNMVNHELMEEQAVMEDHHMESTAINITNHLFIKTAFEN
jgi:hypothetical protein